MRSLYVSQLEPELQTKIKNHLVDFLKEELELTEEIELAMNSRVSNLEDTINIYKVPYNLYDT